MMDRTNFLRELDNLVRLPAGSLTGPETLTDIKGWDSVDETFGIDVPPDKVRQCKRVQDLVDLAIQPVAS